MGLGTSSAYPRSLRPDPPQNMTTFIALVTPFLALENSCLGDRYNKPPTPLTDIAQLFRDFVPQVPWQNQYKVWLSLSYPVRMTNRNVRPRQTAPLLVGISVYRELN